MVETEMLESLMKRALWLGASEAKVIEAKEIVVENRVVLKCRLGCDEYGRKRTCPPYTPPVDEFRKMLAEYRWAMLLKFRSEAAARPEVSTGLLRTENDPDIPQEWKTEATQFWAAWHRRKREILLTMLELEKMAFNLGCTLAVAFTSGSCGLCEQCHPEQGACLHPTMARLPEHAVGINMKRTLLNAGIPIFFPFKGHPEPTGLLLID